MPDLTVLLVEDNPDDAALTELALRGDVPCRLQFRPGVITRTGPMQRLILGEFDGHRSGPDGEIFRSFFRSRHSVICAATILSEIGDCRGRYPYRGTIAADSGQAPVAEESGKRKHAKFRWACNKRLRNAHSTLAQSTRMWNPWAAARYAAARARGHNHRRALRTLGRAWSRILWGYWHPPARPLSTLRRRPCGRRRMTRGHRGSLLLVM